MKPKIIFDTDIGCDCDDSVALAVALELMNAGECQLLAVTSCTMHEAAGGCIEAILRYYGQPDIPVGSFHAEDGFEKNEWHDVYASTVAMKYENRYRRGEHYENSVKLLRKVLANAEEKVTIVATGAMTSLAKLLMSSPDEYSALSGLELVRRKVDRAVCMGGRFAEEWLEPVVVGTDIVEAEWNIKGDITSAQVLCDRWPVELIFCSYEIGLQIITGQVLQTEGREDNPVRTCYEVWGKSAGGAVGRESWDGATMLYAIRPERGYWDLYPYGRVRVDEAGRTTWQPDEGCRHSFLIEKMPPKDIEVEINDILNRDIERGRMNRAKEEGKQ